jgi:hypothetical protein
MKNTDIDNVVRKHKAILGLPQGFGKKPVADKIKILNTKARSKNVALKGFITEYNKLKEAQGTGSKVGGKGGKGGATKSGKMVKDYKKPITEKKGMKSVAKPKPPPKKEVAKPKPKPKPEPSIDDEIKSLQAIATKNIAKKKAEKKAATKERLKEKPKPKGPRPGKVADISLKKPTEGVASGGTPVPTITESNQQESNVFNLEMDNLISSPGYYPSVLDEEPSEFNLDEAFVPDDYQPPQSFFSTSGGPRPVKAPKKAKAKPPITKQSRGGTTKITTDVKLLGEDSWLSPGDIIDNETGMSVFNPNKYRLGQSQKIDEARRKRRAQGIQGRLY